MIPDFLDEVEAVCVSWVYVDDVAYDSNFFQVKFVCAEINVVGVEPIVEFEFVLEVA